jgi:Tfp pilus assembly protein PilF
MMEGKMPRPRRGGAGRTARTSTRSRTRDPAEPPALHVEGFVERFARDHRTRPDRPFLFMLGAGASRSSGIKTGGELVEDWLRDLYCEDPAHDDCDFETWVRDNRAGIESFDPDDRAAAYPFVYDCCFREDPDRGYAYLEDAMERAHPSYGYTVLAQVLATTEHKVVITTNFDNLIADSLALCAQTFLLVCGHESLAGFARARPRRPLILKVHHDLLLGPRSRSEELEEIGEGYREPVTELLKHYTSIVIGYGGNDGSLMGLLDSLPDRWIPGGVYWCYRLADGRPRQPIRAFVARQKGSLVGIADFDRLMVMIGEKLGIGPPDQIIQTRAEEHVRRLTQQFTELTAQLREEVKSAPASATPQGEAAKASKAALRAIEATASAPGEKRWWHWALEAQRETDPDRQEAIIHQGLEALPNDPSMITSAAQLLHKDKRKLDEAEQLYKRGLSLRPGDADTLGSYAFFLKNIRKDHDRASELYERALEADPNHANVLGNYALFLTQIRKDHDRAQDLNERALEADSNNTNYPVFMGIYW